jgi:hypothetical protein
MPRLGFRMVTGATKSDVRMMFLFQSTVRPWGSNCSPRMLSMPLVSSGHSWIISKLASVSTRRPGDVPTAARLYVSKRIGYCNELNLQPM